jgi:nitronate monooxygenase
MLQGSGARNCRVKGEGSADAAAAQAAQIGTAFLACEESGTTAAHREALFSDSAQDTVLTRTYTGRLARGLRNRWVEEMTSRAAALPPFPVQSWFVSNLKAVAMKTGRTDLVPLYGGQIAPNLRHRTAPALLEALVSEMMSDSRSPVSRQGAGAGAGLP